MNVVLPKYATFAQNAIKRQLGFWQPYALHSTLYTTLYTPHVSVWACAGLGGPGQWGVGGG